MRISELSEATSVSVPTLKYYLREGLLMPGVATARTRAEYAETHVERVRLIRALLTSGGLGIAGVRAVLGALDDPPESPSDVLRIAHDALPLPVEPADDVEEMRALLAEAGWQRWDTPLIGSLAAAVADARAAGLRLSRDELLAYAAAMREVAAVDVADALDSASVADALRTVVLGTVLIDPVLVILRRLAQQIETARQVGAAVGEIPLNGMD